MMSPRVVMLPTLRPATCFTSTPPRSVFVCGFTRCAATGPVRAQRTITMPDNSYLYHIPHSPLLLEQRPPVHNNGQKLRFIRGVCRRGQARKQEPLPIRTDGVGEKIRVAGSMRRAEPPSAKEHFGRPKRQAG